MIFEGIPKKEDEGEIIIQIRDTSDYILREFIIKISEKKKLNIRRFKQYS